MRRVMACLLLAGTGGLCGCAQKQVASHFDRSASFGSGATGVEALARAPAPEVSVGTSIAPSPPAHQAPAGQGGAQLASAVDSSRPAGERIRIYTAQLEVSVVDIEAALGSARKMCADAGGYMDAMTSESITMRVPAPKFEGVLEEIRKLGQVLSRNVGAQDVTDEYVDLQLRLKNAEATRERLIAILQKAQTVKETLEVERELSRVRA